MGKFWKGVEGLVKQPLNDVKWMIDETKNVGKPLLRGDFEGAGKAFGHTFGNHNQLMADNITIPLFGENKLQKNPDAVAGAIIGSIFAAPVIGGAMGGGAGGTAGGLSTAANGTAGQMAGAAGQSVYAPTAALSTTGTTMTAAGTPVATTGAISGGSGQAIAPALSGAQAPAGVSAATTTGEKQIAEQVQDLMGRGGQQQKQEEQRRPMQLTDQRRQVQRIAPQQQPQRPTIASSTSNIPPELMQLLQQFMSRK